MPSCRLRNHSLIVHRRLALSWSEHLSQAVSGDDSGAICVWDTKTGMRDGHFMNLHGNAKLTAMTFDASGRRLLTASDTGEVSMWNFTNGSRLRRFKHIGPKLEFTCLLYICDEARQLHQVCHLPRSATFAPVHLDETLQSTSGVAPARGHGLMLIEVALESIACRIML